MAVDNAFRGKYAIVGLGVVGLPRSMGYSARTYQAEAARAAIEDAGLRREDIDGFINAKTHGGSEPRGWRGREGWTDSAARVLGLPINFYWAVGRGGTSAAIGLFMATQALSLGLAKYVAVGYGTTDWATRDQPFELGPKLPDLGAQELGFAQGASAATSHGFFASRHMYEYGTRSEHFGAIAVQIRQWACLHPEAAMCTRGPISIEDHQNSRWVVWPYHLLDCCQQSTGSIVYIVTTAERARDLRHKPVYALGLGFGEQVRKLWWDKANYTQLDVAPAKEAAFRLAGVGLRDIDMRQFYDCFTAEVLFQLEDYGWCKKGEGGPFAAEGHIGPGGDVPCNTGGGMLSAYHMGDYTGFAEAVRQLRGEADDFCPGAPLEHTYDRRRCRQLEKAEVGLVTGHGGEMLFPGMASTHSCIILGGNSG